jgi:cytochrome P450
LPSIFDPALVVDPYPWYHEMRRRNPVHWDEKFQGWIITRHADVTAILHDGRFSSDRVDALLASIPADAKDRFSPLARHLKNWMLFSDSPAHTAIRKLVAPGFVPRMIETLRPRARSFTTTLLSTIAHSAEVDLMSGLANPLPVLMIGALFDLPQDVYPRLKIWSDGLTEIIGSARGTPDNARLAQDSFLDMTDYLREIIRRRRGGDGDDFISYLLHAQDQGSVLTEEELLATCTGVLVAGHETTANLIGNALYNLYRHPDELAKLRQNPNLISSAVEELNRLDGAVNFITRVVREDLYFEGTEMRKGHRVACHLAAANRDPAVFADPDRLDISRPTNRHLAFGHSIHHCLGAPLARLETEVAVQSFIELFPNARLTMEHPEWVPIPMARKLKFLHMALK